NDPLLSRTGAASTELWVWKGCAWVSILMLGHGPVAKAETFRNLVCGGPTMTGLARKIRQNLTASRRADVPRMADDDRKRRNDQGGPSTGVITKTKPQTK